MADNHADKLMMMAPAGKSLVQDAAGLFALPAKTESIRSAVLNVYEAKKEHRRAEAAAVGAAIKLSFDFTVQSGLNVGEKYLLTVKNENGQMVGKCAGQTCSYADYGVFIREMGARTNVTAKLLCIDDLLESESGEYHAHARLLMEWIPSAEECILDRYHVVHRVNEIFNNHHLRFYELMVVKQREVVTSRDQPLEIKINGRLREGTLRKECTFRNKKYVWGLRDEPMTQAAIEEAARKGVYYSPTMTQAEIEEHQRTGVYHAMLSSTNALVPVIPNPRQHVDYFYPLWQAEVSEAIRKCSAATSVQLTVTLIPTKAHVHSWPE